MSQKLTDLQNECIGICFNDFNGFFGKFHLMARKEDSYNFYPVKSIFSRSLEKNINDLYFDEKVDYYITANSTCEQSKRRKEYLFSYNNIVIDIDCHSNDDYSEIKINCEHLYARLKRDVFSCDLLPVPNIINYTGRGMQLWWHLDQCSAKMNKFYNSARNTLIYTIQNRIEEYSFELELDVTASKNDIGLFRMFGSYNTKAKTFGEPVIITKQTYTIQDIASKFYKVQYEFKYEIMPKTKEATYTLEQNFILKDWMLLHKKRIDFFEHIVIENNDCIGRRNKFILWYYNECVQLYSNHEYCKSKTLAFNNKFKEPLEVKEIKTCVFDYIDNVTNYSEETGCIRISTEVFLNSLSLSSDEIKYYSYISGDKQEIIRENKRIAKNMSTNKVIELLNKKITQKEISKLCNVSVRTIIRIKKANNSCIMRGNAC